MDKKMTSGEIAKKAGVSQKAVRLYDEKGLLKPTEYSEGNYRLYDAGALKILEKIVALKQIGFSLEEIRDNLVAGEAGNIEEALRMQLKVMEEKRYRTEMVIDAIKRTLDRKSDSLDWDDVAEIVTSVSLDQEADRNHWLMLQHTVPGEDWYVKVFGSMGFKKDEKILDLGCGFSKIWRNNWQQIPEGAKIFAYDVRGSWAEDFGKFLFENQKDLPEGVSIDLAFEDLEEELSWEKIDKEKTYDKIVAHYLYSELKDPEKLVARASEVLSDGGMFSMNGPSPCTWDVIFKDALTALSLDSSFIDEVISKDKAEMEGFKEMLGKYFGSVEKVILTSSFRYDEADDLLSKMKESYPGQEKFFCKYGEKIREYFAEKIEKSGELLVTTESYFFHCGK